MQISEEHANTVIVSGLELADCLEASNLPSEKVGYNSLLPSFTDLKMTAVFRNPASIVSILIYQETGRDGLPCIPFLNYTNVACGCCKKVAVPGTANDAG